MLNIILQGEAGYRSSDGQMTHARAGDALLFAGDNTIYQESNASPDTDLVRLQLWLQTCPEQNSPQLQHLQLPENEKCLLIASGDGQQGSLKLRQNIRVFQLSLQHEDTHIFPCKGHVAICNLCMAEWNLKERVPLFRRGAETAY